MKELLNNEKRTALYFARRPYDRYYVERFDFSFCRRSPVDQARGKDKTCINELFIMLDTETSKSRPDRQKADGSYYDNDNYIVAWSAAFNVLGFDVCTVWGDSPEQIVPFLTELQETLKGNRTVIYVHNLAYDWQFLRKWCYRSWGDPVSQLNTKPHYPVNIEFSNGIIFRDSLILAQRSIEKWAKDLNVEHGKAVGKWDYDRIRHQKEPMSDDELDYIECDVLAGVECLAALRKALGVTFASMPYTQTGIVRAAGREAGKPAGAHRLAKACYERGYEVYHLLTEIYHGGYTHANRHLSGWTIEEDIKAYDFSSSYPFCMITEPMPIERFWPARTVTEEDILKNMKRMAYIFRFRARDVHLKDLDDPFPSLQLCKVRRIIDCIIDNGRVLDAGYIDIYLNEIDFSLVRRQYTWTECSIDDVYCSAKELLPQWLRDFVYDLYKQKTMLKGGDKVLYALAKARLNSVYGMCVQRVLMDDIIEDPESGDYKTVSKDTPEEFEHEINKRGTFLFYAWGVWTTSAAQRNVHDLTMCVDNRTENALYVDTDSCYATRWNESALALYNKLCKAKLKAAGYDPVMFNGREYIPGVAELDGEYTQFRTVGAKRYCCREKDTGELKLTVSGVPKKAGAKCLEDDIEKFQSGFTFRGEITGKLTHLYQYVDEIYQNKHGDWIADSVNLVPCDYLLDESIEHALDTFGEEEIYIQVYDEDLL